MGGRMKPLPLAGQAVDVEGMSGGPDRIVLRLRTVASPPRERSIHDAALIESVEDVAAARAAGFQAACLIGTGASLGNSFPQHVRLPAHFAYLRDGDIIGLSSHSRKLRVLYRRASTHNAFLVTERCNHYCLMCSQPPRDIDDSWILDEIETALPLIDPATCTIGFTGGEPLIEWRRFISLLDATRTLLPDTEVHVLTNGRGFASQDVASAWAAVGHPRLCAGIPIYSSVDYVHDYVVQARDAFDETVLGILRLKDKGQRVEIRVVLHRITAPRLLETCTWIARNLPFVDHVALMGLENTGFALANKDLLWIDPIDYRDDLTTGVRILSSAGVTVSVYNLPLCLLDAKIWGFAVQSISDWKNAYLPLCNTCGMRDRCAGFFSTGRMRESRGLHALTDVCQEGAFTAPATGRVLW
jgi:His-Xaa-Ser system radical SAM maturase HxsC